MSIDVNYIFFKNFISLTFNQGVNILIALLVTPILFQNLGSINYGLIELAFSIFMLLSILISYGYHWKYFQWILTYKWDYFFKIIYFTNYLIFDYYNITWNKFFWKLCLNNHFFITHIIFWGNKPPILSTRKKSTSHTIKN